MGKRVRGRKRDGRRSSLPPPPPGQEDVAQAERDSRDSESDDLTDRSLGDEGDERGERASEAVVVVAAAEVVAVDLVLPKSASALLSAAIPASARTRAVTPNPSSGATPVASPADVTTRSPTAEANAEAPAADEEPEPTPIIDMPALLEERQEGLEKQIEAAQPEIRTSSEPSAEVTRPDVKALAVQADPAEATAKSDEDTDADLKRADAPTRQGSIPDPTEVSFFDPATVSAHVARAHEPSDAHDIHTLSQAELLSHRRALPEVAARRARLAKYVKITVGTAAALLVLAVLLHLSARSGRAGGQTSEMLVAPPSTAVAEPRADPVKTTAATVPATAPATTGAPTAAPASEAALDAAAAEAPSASAAVPAAAPTDLSPDAAAAAALPLAKFAQLSLERGKLADAIDAGEQATTLDPTDARSWLVLGGAYQDRGDMQKARRCYNSCVGHATRGPVNECRALGGR